LSNGRKTSFRVTFFRAYFAARASFAFGHAACRLLPLMNRGLILSICHLQLLPVSLLLMLAALMAQLLLPLILLAGLLLPPHVQLPLVQCRLPDLLRSQPARAWSSIETAGRAFINAP